MTSLAEMKTQLDELEGQKQELNLALQKAKRLFQMSLWGMGIGVIMLPFYWSGVPVLLIAGIMALVYTGKQSRSQEKLDNLEEQIHHLEISMA